MRSSSAANSPASSPPAPARISRMTFLSSIGSRGSSRTCRRSSIPTAFARLSLASAVNVATSSPSDSSASSSAAVASSSSWRYSS